MQGKTPRHPVQSRADFWQREAATQAAALEASRRENAVLERNYRDALADIARLQEQVERLYEAATASRSSPNE